MKNIPKTIKITEEILKIIEKAKKVAIKFEELTGKKLNITSVVGEVLAGHKNNLSLVIDDINEGYDAFDKNNKKVQIKARRYKRPQDPIGNLLNKDFKVTYDYALLVLLDDHYELKGNIVRKNKNLIQKYFDKKNQDRKKENKKPVKAIPINTFKNL